MKNEPGKSSESEYRGQPLVEVTTETSKYIETHINTEALRRFAGDICGLPADEPIKIQIKNSSPRIIGKYEFSPFLDPFQLRIKTVLDDINVLGMQAAGVFNRVTGTISIYQEAPLRFLEDAIATSILTKPELPFIKFGDDSKARAEKFAYDLVHAYQGGSISVDRYKQGIETLRDWYIGAYNAESVMVHEVKHKEEGKIDAVAVKELLKDMATTIFQSLAVGLPLDMIAGYSTLSIAESMQKYGVIERLAVSQDTFNVGIYGLIACEMTALNVMVVSSLLSWKYWHTSKREISAREAQKIFEALDDDSVDKNFVTMKLK